MNAFKERIRKQRYDEMDKTSTTLEDIPLPDSYEAW